MELTAAQPQPLTLINNIQHRFWHYHETRLMKTIPMIIHYQYVSFKSNYLLLWNEVYPAWDDSHSSPFPRDFFTTVFPISTTQTIKTTLTSVHT